MRIKRKPLLAKICSISATLVPARSIYGMHSVFIRATFFGVKYEWHAFSFTPMIDKDLKNTHL
jgi:hypothetical protein